MKITSFLREKIVLIVIQTIIIGFIALMLNVLGVSSAASVFIILVLILSGVVCMIYEFARKRGFYRELEDRLEGLDQKYLLTEMIERPEFMEGKILYDLMKQVDKSMNDKLSSYHRASNDYREYIETWVHEIKTPIASSRLIIENNKNPVTRSLEAELSRIEGYVEQALYYTRSNSVEKDYIIKRVHLQEMVSSCVKKNARALIESKAVVEMSDLDADVFTDAKWIDFILGQILSNAIKYNEGQPQIKIFAEQRESSVRLAVCDNRSEERRVGKECRY